MTIHQFTILRSFFAATEIESVIIINLTWSTFLEICRIFTKPSLRHLFVLFRLSFYYFIQANDRFDSIILWHICSLKYQLRWKLTSESQVFSSHLYLILTRHILLPRAKEPFFLLKDFILNCWYLFHQSVNELTPRERRQISIRICRSQNSLWRWIFDQSFNFINSEIKN